MSASSGTVKALAHPIRRAIIHNLAHGRDTPQGIADHTGEPLGVVSYHVRMLAQYGVIEVARTEPRRGALQHFYRFTPGAVAELEEIRELAANAIKAARRGAGSLPKGVEG